MALTSGEAPLTSESQGKCRLRLVGDGKEMDVPFSDAEQASMDGPIDGKS